MTGEQQFLLDDIRGCLKHIESRTTVLEALTAAHGSLNEAILRATAEAVNALYFLGIEGHRFEDLKTQLAFYGLDYDEWLNEQETP